MDENLLKDVTEFLTEIKASPHFNRFIRKYLSDPDKYKKHDQIKIGYFIECLRYNTAYIPYQTFLSAVETKTFITGLPALFHNLLSDIVFKEKSLDHFFVLRQSYNYRNTSFPIEESNVMAAHIPKNTEVNVQLKNSDSPPLKGILLHDFDPAASGIVSINITRADGVQYKRNFEPAKIIITPIQKTNKLISAPDISTVSQLNQNNNISNSFLEMQDYLLCVNSIYDLLYNTNEELKQKLANLQEISLEHICNIKPAKLIELQFFAMQKQIQETLKSIDEYQNKENKEPYDYARLMYVLEETRKLFSLLE